MTDHDEARPPRVPTILVVEDEPQVRTLVCVVLMREGYQVLEAADGREGLAVATSHSGAIDLVLTDAVMPEMNGPELVARLRETQPDVPVIYMSGYSGSTVSRAILDSADDYLQKPMSRAMLTERVKAVLDGHSARRPNG
jgi:DNA-binding response OmpR family regulator